MSAATDLKITYATLSGPDLAILHKALDDGIERLRPTLGQTYPMIIGGEEVTAAEQFEETSPADTRVVVGRFQDGTPEHARAAVAAAKAALPEWSARPWQERVAIIRKAADLIEERRIELSVLMGFETGKNRLECLGDVQESADFLQYYADQVEANDGFVKEMGKLGGKEENLSVMRPWGVFAVIAPFNFPMALATGPSGAALLTGNTVVFKPAEDTSVLGYKLAEILYQAGVPRGAFNYVTGDGPRVGQPLVDSEDVDGIVFTGSREVGFGIMRQSAQRTFPRPVIAEMGGKNPAIIMPSADLEKAAAGVARSAFGATGQKCSACSRVYVHGSVKERFLELLAERTGAIRVGDPLEEGVYVGPLINAEAAKRHADAVAGARADGGRIVAGGEPLEGEPYEHGHFVAPTVVTDLPLDHELFREELFVPLVVVGAVESLDQALELANRTEYGLTAGIFSEDEAEIERFFDTIEAGVVYANRAAGATTGAWPGINPFGGWKASASTSRGSGGEYYVQQFLREQSRVRIYG